MMCPFSGTGGDIQPNNNNNNNNIKPHIAPYETP